jgi:RNA polymerase sigma-70 factor (ECF subfamily)
MATHDDPDEEAPALRQLMADYQAGRVDAFDALYAALAPDLRAYLTSLARDATRADDLLQETFLQMHRSRASHIPGYPVRPWVFAIAKRTFLMFDRSARRRVRRETDPAAQVTAQPTATPDQIHARHEVHAALRRVGPDGRRVFLLHHLFGFSFKEIAAKLGINTGAAKIRSSRARQAIRQILERKDDDTR